MNNPAHNAGYELIFIIHKDPCDKSLSRARV
jgi:hypothetical protein